MNEVVNLPVVGDLSSTVQAAKSFESLGITGVLFLMLVVLSVVLFFKSKNNEQLNNLTHSINELVAVSKETINTLQALNSGNNAVIVQKLDTLMSTLNKVESTLWELNKK